MTAVQGSAARLVEVALAEIGYIEGPKDNETKYGAFTKSNFQPWCGSFVMWCANQAGVKVPNTVYTPAGAQAFMKAGTWQPVETAAPAVGDIVYFDFPNDGVDRISHVGIVVAVNNDGTVDVVEGNTSPDKKGDQRNGGEACLKNRAYKKKNGSKLRKSQPVFIVGFGRPAFGQAVKTKAEEPAKTVNTTTLAGILEASKTTNKKPAAKKPAKPKAAATETVNTTTLDGIIKASKKK